MCFCVFLCTERNISLAFTLPVSLGRGGTGLFTECFWIWSKEFLTHSRPDVQWRKSLKHWAVFTGLTSDISCLLSESLKQKVKTYLKSFWRWKTIQSFVFYDKHLNWYFYPSVLIFLILIYTYYWLLFIFKYVIFSSFPSKLIAVINHTSARIKTRDFMQIFISYHFVWHLSSFCNFLVPVSACCLEFAIVYLQAHSISLW